MSYPAFICALCGREFETEYFCSLHIFDKHNAMVYRKDNMHNAIPYKEYLQMVAQDANEITEEEDDKESET
jgi:hypothetical protein